jgi:hypothetical protein
MQGVTLEKFVLEIRRERTTASLDRKLNVGGGISGHRGKSATLIDFR